MIALAALSRLLDIATTLGAIRWLGATEANPLAASLMSHGTLAWITPQAVWILGYALLWKLSADFPKLQTCAKLICLVSWTPVIWNFWSIMYSLVDLWILRLL